ncbi:beta-galactosidase [Motilibacter rhizosphaerae]|uniref:Beta-galactosidase n=2 Tax=Motilibacter rhizosphaerae TaxID=598652 RepID=A0A4Q7NVG9_9ACTN|nr:beta-galactosidase [Motilibacter rhizosphaerae]
MARTFEIGEQDFLLDGKPFRILSGALHYFRVHPDQWEDRIRKARLLGLNTVETYVAWNAHAPDPDVFDLSGGLDLGRFLDLVHAAGLLAIVRPGPFICAEWDGGGLPAWLFRDPATGVRGHEERYLAAVDAYLERLAPVLVPRQVEAGGPIALVQVENEYGAYGADQDYLRHLVELYQRVGLTVPYTTVDQPTDEMLAAGSLPELHKTASFGSRPAERLATLRRHQPTGPLMCAEFWNGWFDAWGEHHHTTDAQQSAADLDELLSLGASVNLYMLHGGTNFGFTNGANDKGVYRPTVTSYDYDAPLDEAGHPTAKFWAFREVLARHTVVPDEEIAPAAPAPALRVPVQRVRALSDALGELGTWRRGTRLPSFDDLGHWSGFAVYRTRLPHGAGGVLELGEVRDRALVSVDGRPVGVLARDSHERRLSLPPGEVLELLVEDQGRVNYGARIGEAKGLVGPARVDGAPLRDWEVMPLELDRAAEALSGAPGPRSALSAGPVLVGTTFDVASAPADLFLDTSGWGKGVAWVNGWPLGRYWSRGPQTTLYVPGPVVRERGNELVLLELHAARDSVSFVEGLRLGHTEA